MSALDPVEVYLERDHAFDLRPGTKHSCRCGRPRVAPEHGPFSYRLLGSGNRFVYQAAKSAWEAAWIAALTGAGMPTCASVHVEGLITFPDRRARDEGNHRFAIEKFLGDALQRGGWLSNDDWTRYRFGPLESEYRPGVSAVRLMIFPTALERRAAA